jgi:hypothetical protein
MMDVQLSASTLYALGWTLIRNDGNVPLLPVVDLCLVPFVSLSEEYVTWDAMLKRAHDAGAVSTIANAEAVLGASDLIPGSWRGYRILFPGTIWSSRTRHLHCPCLAWGDDGWGLELSWFLFDFHHVDRFIRPQVLT